MKISEVQSGWNGSMLLKSLAGLWSNTTIQSARLLCVTALSYFQQFYNYRSDEINSIKRTAMQYIRNAQRPDGSWYGSWGICFTYAGMFALESLASVGDTYEKSERARKGCEFLISKANV